MNQRVSTYCLTAAFLLFPFTSSANKPSSQPASQPTTRSTLVATKPVKPSKKRTIQKAIPKKPSPQKMFAKVLDVAKQRNNLSFYTFSKTMEAPGLRIPNIKVNWKNLPTGLPQQMGAYLQQASLQMFSALSQGKPSGWVKLGKSRYGKQLNQNGSHWYIVGIHRRTSNQLMAYNPSSGTLFNASGMYLRGRLPAMFYMDQATSPLNAYKSVVSKSKQRKPRYTVQVEVPGHKNYPYKTVAWYKVPRAIPEMTARLLQQLSLHQIKGGKEKFRRIEWTKLPKAVKAGTLLFGRRRWQVFVEHQYSRNVLYLFEPYSQQLFRAVGQYYRGQAPALLTLQGPYQP